LIENEIHKHRHKMKDAIEKMKRTQTILCL
jgi:hypothetical protein